MGLIVLLIMGVFIFVIALVLFTYISIARKIFTTNISKPIRLITIVALLPVFALLLYYLFLFYQNSSDMIYARGFFGIAPKTAYSAELNTTKGTLSFTVELDFNTGARGGAFINNSLFYIENGIKREIKITEHEIRMHEDYYKEALDMQVIADETESHKHFGEYYLDLYLSPKQFTLDEFLYISRFLQQNHSTLSKLINDYKENQKSRVFNKIRFRNTYYQDINSLNKTYKCDNNLLLHLSATGRLFFITKDDISTSYNDIGYVKENGHKLVLDNYVELSEKNGTRQITRRGTLIKECFDSNGTNLFEEFQLVKI